MNPLVQRLANALPDEVRATLQGWLRRRRRRGRPALDVAEGLETVVLGLPNRHVFFGYYDLTPFHPSRPDVLAIEVPMSAEPSRTPARILLFDGDAQPRTVGETDLWCWQQGCRLRWHPQNADVIVHNGSVDERPATLFRNAATGEVEAQVPWPVYDLRADGAAALSLNFDRLERLRPGYGYRPDHDATRDQAAPEADGVFRIDIEAGTREQLVSLADLARECAGDGERQHYVNHLAWNPSGDRFLVFHLWTDGQRRANRALVFDASGTRVAALTKPEEAASHYAWLSDETLLLTLSDADGIQYVICDVESGSRRPLAACAPNADGHPSPDPSTRGLILSDTYPDRLSEQSVFVLDPTPNRLAVLARAFAPARFRGPVRCDLHPRFSGDGNAIAFDSPHLGRRALVVLRCPKGEWITGSSGLDA